ncbi:MAG TPA: mechanosensitive ion channel domain-containing protein [Streptosporangiaceae bacterium]|nr:mechanosensitive ion channel domain-containing protein [Streptosporangiaceae bacterium]
MQSWEQIDLPAKVETVRRKTRPWKAIIALLLAIVAAVVAYDARERLGFFHGKGISDLARHLVWPGSAIAFCALGSMATYGLAGKARQILEPRVGTSHAAITRYALLIIGAFTTLVVTLELFGVPIGQLVLGGALTSVFVGIAAQQALSNVFAGLVLLFARPFRVGDTIRLRAGALGGQIEGTVADIGITYVRLDSGGSIIAIPNSQVLNAVVGPVPAGEDAVPPGQTAPLTQALPPAQPAPDTPAATATPAASGNPAAATAPAAATTGTTTAGTAATTATAADRADRQQPPTPPT